MLENVYEKENVPFSLESMVGSIRDVREFWRRALDAQPVPFPYEDHIRRYDPTKAASPITLAFKKNPSEEHLARCGSLYFGVYEVNDSWGLSGKVLYLSGMDRADPDPEFTTKTMIWKPRWGRFRPALFKMIARIEDGIDPSKKLKPPLKTEETFGNSTITVLDFNAGNPELEFVDLSGQQKQHLNYYVTFVAALAIMKAALPSIPFDGPIYTGFDEGDILRVR